RRVHLGFEGKSGRVARQPRPCVYGGIRFSKIVPVDPILGSMLVTGRAVAQSNRVDPHRGANSQRRAPASHPLLRIGAARGRWRCPRGRVGRGTDVNELGSVTMPCIASAIEGDGADLRSGSALDVRGRKDYISRLTRSERLGPEVRLVGAPIVAYRKGNRSE